ncbi:SDR family NAD(P)-dependent oxidoreductase [Streptomyces sp. NPDC007164]|uniref:SDR family oxidoreductase n=1 Tax=Streptomyces sp. NPDC007164 TaxID=3156918 RepID=UPI0033C8B7BA
MSGITGKVVAVTGASSGIGEATVLLLAERGARLVLGARRTERLADLTARIKKSGGEAVHLRTNVTRIAPAMAVYAGTKAAVRAVCEGLRQEAGPTLRVTTVSPGLIATDFAEASSNDRVRGDITRMRDEVAIEPAAVARAIAYAIEQPADVDVNEIVVRPTAQS